MSKNIEKCKEKLIFISSIRDKQIRIKLINLLWDKCFENAIKEIILNKEKGFINLNTKERRSLNKYKKPMKAFAEGKQINKNKFKNQLGGFWGMLIPAALSALSLIK